MPRQVQKQPSETKPTTAAVAMPVVYAISDSTGNLARHMLTAFLTQFPPDSLSVRFEAFVRTELRLGEVLAKARTERAVVCHAMVSPRLKERIARFCHGAGL